MNEQIQHGEEREYPHWNRVYITVIIYTICLIVVLWLFSRMFQ
jgi:heme/copper-type cytochrome/quinol oxidase subunit 2